MDDHLISDFMSAGCTNRKKASIALQVYLELCEVKRYWNVEYKYNHAFDLLYFSAHKTKSEPKSIFIPIDAHSNDMTLNKMRSYFSLSENINQKRVFLALVSTDSTCVYYQITDGLFEPTDLTAKHLKTNKQEQLDAEIKRHRNVLQEAALCGVAVTIPRTPCPPKESIN